MNKRRAAWLGQQTNNAMDKRDTGTGIRGERRAVSESQ